MLYILPSGRTMVSLYDRNNCTIEAFYMQNDVKEEALNLIIITHAVIYR
jgi:hypothetical protein